MRSAYRSNASWARWKTPARSANDGSVSVPPCGAQVQGLTQTSLRSAVMTAGKVGVKARTAQSESWAGQPARFPSSPCWHRHDGWVGRGRRRSAGTVLRIWLRWIVEGPGFVSGFPVSRELRHRQVRLGFRAHQAARTEKDRDVARQTATGAERIQDRFGMLR